ncbi:L-ribulose-5-phosphate 4-epimerase [Arthrobacter methylotrophus]|uniref:L-ribulose-5-phosphate 4-epimerase n=1 Tax=Arthrobacter methylotrophus TaxID=121291 RepID=A0ABV5USV3_9MICC
MLEELKEEVCQANLDLLAHGLVVGTSGNVSGRDDESGLVVIKPSGVAFDVLRPEHMSVVDLHGTPVEGPYRPSVDTVSHVYVYRERADINGVVHTHSPYATSFALRGEPIPVFTTTHAALFGGPIPISGYAVIGEEEIGREIVAHVGVGTAVLMRSHGVFTIGADPQRALRSALYTEECAEAAHLAILRGYVEPLPPQVVQASRDWYLTGYGQRPIGAGS